MFFPLSVYDMEGAWHEMYKFSRIWGLRSGEACHFGRIKIRGIGLERSLAKVTWSDMVTVLEGITGPINDMSPAQSGWDVSFIGLVGPSWVLRVLEVLFSCSRGEGNAFRLFGFSNGLADAQTAAKR